MTEQPDTALEPVGTRQTSIDDFDIIKTIGTGTFARVFLCKEKSKNNNKQPSYYALKSLAIHDVIRLKQVAHVKSEKSILLEINHPFLVGLIWHYKDRKHLYMLFPFICGGELFTYLRSLGRFGTSTAQFYAAEIISALDYLHARGIVYRDLKPENLLLDKAGHLCITDFGFAKRLCPPIHASASAPTLSPSNPDSTVQSCSSSSSNPDSRLTWTLCGTPEYLAPEIIQSKGHNFAVDWWALGILVFEMLCGYPPFFDDNPFGVYEKILNAKVDFPRHLDTSSRDLIKRLLVTDRAKRLGALKNGADDVKRHRWLRGIDWEVVIRKGLVPPIVPEINGEGDTSNYDEYPEIKMEKVPDADEE